MNKHQHDLPATAAVARQWRYASVVIWLAVGVALVASFIGQLFSASADLGHHAVLISRLMESWWLPETDANLQYMTSYPRGAHLLGSIVGLLSGSALNGMQTVAILALFGLWSAIGASLNGLQSRQGLRAAACLGIALLLNTVIGLEVFGNELISNYFFAHMVSQSLALVVFVVALRSEFATSSRLVSYLALGIAAPLLTSVHLLPAIELLGTLALLILANFLAGKSKEPKRELLTGIFIVAASACLTIANPAFRAMYQVSGHEGTTLLRFITGLPSLVAVATVTILLSSALLVVWWRERNQINDYPAMLAKYFGALGLSVSGLCLLQILLHSMFDLGSQYACFKYAIGMQSLLVVNLALLSSLFWKKDDRSGSGFHKAIIPTALATCAVLTLFLRHSPIPTHALVTAEKDARAYAKANVTKSPGKQDIAVDIQGVSQVGSYLISRASLGTSDEWMLYEVLLGQLPSHPELLHRVLTSPGSKPWDVPICRRGIAGSLVVVDGVCAFGAMGSLPCAGTINFSSRGALDKVVTGFSPAEPNGRWSEGSNAVLRCKVETALPATAYLNTVGLVTDAHMQRMIVSVNDEPAQTVEYSAQSPSRVVAIPLPHQAASELVFKFTFPDAISPRDLGMSIDSRMLAVKMHSLRFEQALTQ